MKKKEDFIRKDSNIVIRINENEFEMKDGTVFQHPEKLDIMPSIEEFQKIYDYWNQIIKK